MELSLKTISLFGATVLTALSAGLFLAWSISVIPGTKKITDSAYLETMQSINREILNPTFFLVFFGSLLLLFLVSVQTFQSGINTTFWLVLTSTILYAVGTIGVTGLGNVPLNNMLEASEIVGTAKELTQIRLSYEPKWNMLHGIRTICAVLSFIILLLAVFQYPKIN